MHLGPNPRSVVTSYLPLLCSSARHKKIPFFVGLDTKRNKCRNTPHVQYNSTQWESSVCTVVQSQINFLYDKATFWQLKKQEVVDKQGVVRTTGTISSHLHLWFFTPGPHSSSPDGNWPEYVHTGPRWPKTLPLQQCHGCNFPLVWDSGQFIAAKPCGEAG